MTVSFGDPTKISVPVSLTVTLVPNFVSISTVPPLSVSTCVQVVSISLYTNVLPAVVVVESVASLAPTANTVPSWEISIDSPNLAPTSLSVYVKSVVVVVSSAVIAVVSAPSPEGNSV